MRVRHKPWATDQLAAHTDWVIADPKEKKGKWHQVFHNEHPIHIEIGTGKGQFIIGMAKANPKINFIGIEFQQSIIVEALDKVLETPLENVRLLNVNAADLTEFFSDGEVATIYLNFSDPWPKNRHEKRRLTYASFLAHYKKVLGGKGKIELKTDNQGLFEYSLESFSAFGYLLKAISLDLHTRNELANVKTEYEEKFSKKGHRIYRCEAWLREGEPLTQV
ncbi:MAG TPA: tRNA (guanosine(46)-N7)-methyltransferase TrmB [Candidatus Angelobacter sp.]|nr:tRNA (guanosine(46)-N7)-methyltransferase TrmB [Candidatus Angelobacter sp.]